MKTDAQAANRGGVCQIGYSHAPFFSSFTSEAFSSCFTGHRSIGCPDSDAIFLSFRIPIVTSLRTAKLTINGHF
jgi:hypothetical protein